MTKQPRVDSDYGSDSTCVATSDLTPLSPDLYDTDSRSEVSEVQNIASNVLLIEATRFSTQLVPQSPAHASPIVIYSSSEFSQLSSPVLNQGGI